MIVLAIDTETTGLVESPLARVKFQPHVIEFSCAEVDLDSGEVRDQETILIRPPDLSLIREKITEITGITVDVIRDAPQFASVADRVFSRVERHESVAAHNLSYDKMVLDLEAARLGRSVKWPRRRICTVEQSAHLFGYNLDLTSLHEYLLGAKFEGAHSAAGDVMALVRCLVEMRKRGDL